MFYYNYPIEDFGENLGKLDNYEHFIKSMNNLSSILIKDLNDSTQIVMPISFSFKDESGDYNYLPIITQSFLSPSQVSTKELFIGYNFDKTNFDDVLISLRPKSKSTYTFIPKYELKTK